MAAGPLNPPTLGARRVGSFTGAGIGCTVEKKLYGGRGLGLVGAPQMGGGVFQIGGLTVGKLRISRWGRFRSAIVVQGGFRRSPGELLGAPGRPKVVERRPILDQFEVQGDHKLSKSRLKVI